MVHHWNSTDPAWQAWHLSDHVSRCGDENSGKINGCVHVISKMKSSAYCPSSQIWCITLDFLLSCCSQSKLFPQSTCGPQCSGFPSRWASPCSSSLCKLPPLCPSPWLSFIPHTKDFSDLSYTGPHNLYDIIYVPWAYYGPSIWY